MELHQPSSSTEWLFYIPPYNVDGTILIAGCGSSAGQRGSVTRSNNGQGESMIKTGWKLTTFRRKIKYRGEAFKQKERYDWGSISKHGSYDGKWICESGRGSPTKLHGIAIAVTAQNGSNVKLFASWYFSRKHLLTLWVLFLWSTESLKL